MSGRNKSKQKDSPRGSSGGNSRFRGESNSTSSGSNSPSSGSSRSSNSSGEWTGKSITKLSLHKKRKTLFKDFGLEHIPFVFFYIYSLYHCLLTFGGPYVDRIEELKQQGRIPLNATTDELVYEALQNTTIILPNPYLPGFFPLLIFSFTLFSHVLLVLLQVWFVNVLTSIKYSPCKTLQEAEFVKIVPCSHRGKTELIPLQCQSNSVYFIFQHNKYIYTTAATTTRHHHQEEGGGRVTRGVFEKVRSHTKRPLNTFVPTGLSSQQAIDETLSRFGKNVFSVPSPTFLELYKQQLVQPLTVFQLFCTVLWLLDEYWKYALFSVGMILLFEGVTVFTRMKSVNMIRGMGNPPKQIWVYRLGSWAKVSTENLLPGDVISIKHEPGTDDIIPCDCLLLRGLCVVNEASLTGESHPQMKEEVSQEDQQNCETLLDMKSTHKIHILFGGTTIMQHTPSKDHPDSITDDIDPTKKTISIPPSLLPTPDSGCLAYVLRTGFNSSQGKLVRMIEYSSEHVRSDSWDAFFLVSFLMIFAISASSYVLKKGLENKNRSNFELLLHCTMIITGVVPPELPMQTALAVNTALMALMKLHIFCTEPFRIPTAGKIDICLFDKTGTITADHLTAVGVVGYEPRSNNSNNNSTVVTEHHHHTSSDPQNISPMISAPFHASMVLGGCHSLVDINGKITGDPVEEAAINAIHFQYDSHKRVAYPKQWVSTVSWSSTPSSRPSVLPQRIQRSWPRGVENNFSIEILHRNHFSSKLQRMSVVARVRDGSGPKICSLVKGSPEALSELMRDDAKPQWYWNTYMDLTRKGMRVLAMAYREMEQIPLSEISKQPRSWAENNLRFAGFVAFRCPVRKDSKEIIQQLIEGSHKVMMITGDATLTATFVAQEVGLAKKASKVLILTDKKDQLQWTIASDDSFKSQFLVRDIPQLAQKYCLCISGSSLIKAAQSDPNTWKHLDKISVFARMTPELKERVIAVLKENGHFCMMCGDGANDVGALKQSHVGVALLTGFGSLNASPSGGGGGGGEGEGGGSTQNTTSTPSIPPSTTTKITTTMTTTTTTTTTATTTTAATASPPSTSPSQMTPQQRREMMQAKLEREVEARMTRGETCPWPRAMWHVMREETTEARRLAQERQGQGFAGQAQRMALDKYLAEMENPGDLPVVKLGDASIAAPFTSKIPSIQATVDIIRQGRCALVTTLQMYQILALNCLISAYSLSVLYLDGIKYGDNQLMASGILITISFLTLSRATPLNNLSSVRPLTTIFHPALFVSLIGQFAIHMTCMIYVTSLTKQFTPDWVPNLYGQFQPSLLNTVVFLTSTVQSVSVFVVNYKGRPFMVPMTDNPGLLYSLGACFIGVFVAATESVPAFNKILQLVPFPNPDFAMTIFTVLVSNILSTLVWDFIAVYVFAKNIITESSREVTREDVRKFVQMAFILIIAILLFTPSEEDFERIRSEIDWG